MTSVVAGLPVKRGYYFSIDRWSLEPIEKDGTALVGERGERFVAVPLAIAVVLAPLLGAAFLMFMPFIGFYLLAQSAMRPVAVLFRGSSAQIAASMAPGLQPGQAHLTGRRGNALRGPGTLASLDALEREIEARRAAAR